MRILPFGRAEYKSVLLSIFVFMLVTILFVILEFGAYYEDVTAEETSDVAGLKSLLFMFLGYYFASFLAGLSNSYYSYSTDRTKVYPMMIIILTLLLFTIFSSTGLDMLVIIVIVFILGIPACLLFLGGCVLSTKLFGRRIRDHDHENLSYGEVDLP